MEVLLDTNFIISCILRKIDFLSQLKEIGFKAVIPKKVIQELKDLRLSSKTSREERVAIDVAMEIISSKEIKKMTMGIGKVDDMLIKKGKEGVYIATLDNEIKRQVPNKIVIFSSQKRIGIERS